LLKKEWDGNPKNEDFWNAKATLEEAYENAKAV
jgi:hypothetical protein